ncbi:MAG: DUF4124 domain-containing protein [Betaproteobacteria bacterium]|nr:DUF4124 domain-containing protein [Betaproteobacteria bacterium]
MNRVSQFVCCVVALWALASAAAQTLYKSTMPDGRIVYGDKPAPGAVKVEPVKTDTAPTGVQVSPAREAGFVKQMEAERLKREQQHDAVRAAEKALREAEAALAAGKEPLSGERIGTAGGASRLTEAYWERQKSLEQAVSESRRELERLRSGR